MGQVWDRGIDILRTTLDAGTNTIRAFLGNATAGGREEDEAEWWQHSGFVSRPPKAQKGVKNGAAQALYLRSGGRDAVIASRDPAGQKLAGSLADGETCLYASGRDGTGQARVLLKANGSIALYTSTGASAQALAVIVDPESDSITLINSTGNGIVIDATGVKLTAGDSGISLNADGSIKVIATQQAQVDGASILLGSAAVPGVNAVCVGPVGMAAVGSTKVICQIA